LDTIGKFKKGGNQLSTARYCKNCGKKYYPKSYYSYPQVHLTSADYLNGTSDEVKLEYARFHSLSCMTEWLNNNKEAFAELVDNISQNVIEDNQTINQ
jgi:hypothetical protein